MSPAQPGRPPSGAGRARVWIMPCMSCRNQAGEPFAAGPEDAASLVCAAAIVAVNKRLKALAAQTKWRFFISSPHFCYFDRHGCYEEDAAGFKQTSHPPSVAVGLQA